MAVKQFWATLNCVFCILSPHRLQPEIIARRGSIGRFDLLTIFKASQPIDRPVPALSEDLRKSFDLKLSDNEVHYTA